MNDGFHLPVIDLSGQITHAKEILPHKYETYLATLLLQEKLPSLIFGYVEKSLPIGQKHLASTITKAVIVEGNRWGLDPLFLIAVIKTESHFNTKARGQFGEIGLMQIRPQTGAWIASRQKVLEPQQISSINLEDPLTNIQLGAAYFANLRVHFAKNVTRYVAAYNMGPKNVRKLLQVNTEPNEYPQRVFNNYLRLYRALQNFENTKSHTADVASR